jgi:ABC-type Mn2+/Zn2+ transport system ATPase subunit
VIHFHPHPSPRFPYSGRGHADPLVTAPAVALSNVSLRYPSADRDALTGATLDIPRGRLAAVVGPNGAGKSSLLKLIAGLLTPAAGTVSVFGNRPGDCHHRTAYLPQRGDIDWQFPVTLDRLVLAGRYVHRGWFARPTAADRALVDRTLDRLGIAAFAGRQIAALSGGQQQRALVARAVVQGAELLLLDEPFNNLDVDTRGDLTDLLADLRAAGRTLVVATHDTHTLDRFDTVVRVRDGAVS